LIEDRSHQNEFRIFFAVVSIIFFILYARYFQLQVVSGSFYKKRSDMNSVRQIPITAARGTIYDRNSTVLVDNKPSYSLFVVPFEFNKNKYRTDIKKITSLDPEEISRKIKSQKTRPFLPVRLLSNMTFSQLSMIEEHRIDLPGFFYHAEPVRFYPSEVNASHVLGFLGEITKSELEHSDRHLYHAGDIVGRSGIEKEYDSVLRGIRGYMYKQVDVTGRETGDFGGKRDLRPVSGRSLMLTLDVGMQKLAENLLKNKKGAIVVMDPNNGEIYAMASSPDYDPGIFSGGVSSSLWNKLMSNPEKPLLNRPVQAQLPPGSVFKLVTATAAQAYGIRSPDYTDVCNGAFILGNKIYRCWREEGHGELNLYQAIAKSCNVYFYRTGIDLGIDKISDIGRKLGLGLKTDVDIPGELTGIMPDKNYLDAKYGRGRWTKGMIANIAVGQGDVLVTPIQIAQVAAAVATSGLRPVPHIVKAVQNKNKKSWTFIKPEYKKPVDMLASSLEIIKEGMRMAVMEPGGTAVLARIKGVSICGKTGTAQNPRGEPHAWFAGFGPYENPEIVVVVVIENSGSGGSVAAPVAGQLFREFFL